jgi:hypothetical protein
MDGKHNLSIIAINYLYLLPYAPESTGTDYFDLAFLIDPGCGKYAKTGSPLTDWAAPAYSGALFKEARIAGANFPSN